MVYIRWLLQEFANSFPISSNIGSSAPSSISQGRIASKIVSGFRVVLTSVPLSSDNITGGLRLFGRTRDITWPSRRQMCVSGCKPTLILLEAGRSASLELPLKTRNRSSEEFNDSTVAVANPSLTTSAKRRLVASRFASFCGGIITVIVCGIVAGEEGGIREYSEMNVLKIKQEGEK